MRGLIRHSTAMVAGVGLALGLVAAPATAAQDVARFAASTGAGAEQVVDEPAAVGQAEVGQAEVGQSGVDLPSRYVHLVVYTYRDLLGRDPEMNGLVTWQGALLNGASRSAVANAITHSDEYRGRLVRKAYEEYLGRAPDPAGLAFWVAAMGRGWTVARIGAGFISSPEYYARAGGTPEGWVAALYRDVLHRDASASEVAGWVGAVARGTTREQVALGFLLSSEHLGTVVDGYYQTLLRRHLDPAGRQSWVALLQAGHHDEEIVGGIIASDEYWNLTALFPLNRLTVTPGSATAAVGEGVRFAAMGHGAWDASSDDLGDLTSQATFTIDGQPCPQATCSSTVPGVHVVSASIGDLWTAAELVVTPGPLDKVALAPSDVTIADGASVVYAAQGFDAYDNPLGDVTSQVAFAVDGDAAACEGTRCRPAGTGVHTVTVVGALGEAAVTMSPPGPQGYELWGWGSNSRQLGGDDGDYGDVLAPRQIGTDDHWAAVAGGTSPSVAVKTDGSLWSWGEAPCSAPGEPDLRSPEQFGFDVDWMSAVTSSTTTVAIKDDGTMWAWGDIGFGEDPSRVECAPVPVGEGQQWRAVATFWRTWVAIAADGSLWTWGYNGDGQLGDGTRVSRAAPTFVDAGPWSAAALSYYHTVGLKEDGTLWAWGDNRNGRLGDGTRVSSAVPVQVGSRTDWTSVAATAMTSIAVASDGSLWWWGGSKGLNYGHPDDALSPTFFDSSHQWARVTASSGTRIAMASDGTVWGWGGNGNGQLGDGTKTNRTAPVQVGSGAGWIAVEPYVFTTLALRDPAASP